MVPGNVWHAHVPGRRVGPSLTAGPKRQRLAAGVGCPKTAPCGVRAACVAVRTCAHMSRISGAIYASAWAAAWPCKAGGLSQAGGMHASGAVQLPCPLAPVASFAMITCHLL